MEIKAIYCPACGAPLRVNIENPLISSDQGSCIAGGGTWGYKYTCPYYYANLASNNRCYYTTTETETETGLSSCTPQTEFSSCTYDLDGKVNITCTEE